MGQGVEMTRIEVIQFEYENCGECPNVEKANRGKWKCLLKRKIVPDLWGKIPDWCPLEVKK